MYRPLVSATDCEAASGYSRTRRNGSRPRERDTRFARSAIWCWSRRMYAFCGDSSTGSRWTGPLDRLLRLAQRRLARVDLEREDRGQARLHLHACSLLRT